MEKLLKHSEVGIHRMLNSLYVIPSRKAIQSTDGSWEMNLVDMALEHKSKQIGDRNFLRMLVLWHTLSAHILTLRWTTSTEPIVAQPSSHFRCSVTGAEVVRMYKPLLGQDRFRKGMDLYFQRHDGQAVTCEDFFAAMRDANATAFADFLLWYSQAGTPSLKVTSSYDAKAKTYSLKFSQEVPPTPGQPKKEPMFIPMAMGLLDSNGKDIPLTSVFHDDTLQFTANKDEPVYSTFLRITKKEVKFIFFDISERTVPSLLRGYSAPIRLESDLTDSDLFFLLSHDSDEFNRWEAGQILARKLMLSSVADFQEGKELTLNQKFIEGLRSTLLDTSLDKEFVATSITLPGEGEIMDLMKVADPDAVHAVRKFIRNQLATELKEELLSTLRAICF